MGIGPGGTDSMVEQEKKSRSGQDQASGMPAGYEYGTLMNLMRVSVSKHLLDEHFTLVWANEFYYELIGWPKGEYEARFHNQPDLYYKDDQELWDDLTQTVIKAVEAHQAGYQMVSRLRRFADEYIDGYQVAYSCSRILMTWCRCRGSGPLPMKTFLVLWQSTGLTGIWAWSFWMPMPGLWSISGTGQTGSCMPCRNRT